MAAPKSQQWTTEEVDLVALLFAIGFAPEQVKDVHEAFGFSRSRVALANAKTQRPDVRDRMREWVEVLGNDSLAPDHPELRELERKLSVQEGVNSDLRRKLKEADKRSHEVGVVLDEVRAVVQPYRDPPAPKPRVVASSATPVSMVSILSDIHADAIIDLDSTWGLEDYDFDVARARMERWTDLQIAYLTKHLPQHHFEELWVLGLGDYLHGDIHGHGPRNHFRSTPKAAIATGDLVADSLYEIWTQTGVPIRVVSVSGNHPRRSARKDFDGPQDNYDYVTMVQAATRLREVAGIDIALPNAWTALVEIRGKIWCLNHGDDVTGFAGHPWYGFSRKNARVQAIVARKDVRVDYFVYGHFHTPAMVSESAHTSWHNGAFPLTDAFAAEKVSACNTPQQWAFVQDESRGILNCLPLYVQDLGLEMRLRAGSWDPRLGKNTGLDIVAPETTGQRDIQLIRR